MAYQRIAEIARGGMGVVYLALARGSAGFHKLCVLKELKPHLAEDPTFLEMFVDEARIATRLHHPNVVQTHEVASEGSRHFIVMELLEGQTFHRLLARASKKGALVPLELRLRVISEVLAGLHYAHELRADDGSPMALVHRDVSPHNVFVTYDGLVKLLDFGIAKAACSSHVTRAGFLKGKVTYMAPEQARGGAIDRRADLFSVGVMLWEAIAERRMWQGQSELAVLHELASGRIPSLYEAKPEAPLELVAICDRALSLDPNHRYATAAELRDDLESWLQGAGAARELGVMAAHLFAAERARIDEIVERQVHAADAHEALEVVELHPQQSGSHSLAPRPSMTTAGVIASQRPAPPPRRVNLVLVLALVAAASVAAALSLRPEPLRAASAVGRIDVALPWARKAETATPASVHLTVRVSPPTARIFVDDVELETNPIALPRDGARHVVRVEADGFVTKRETVGADRDVMLSVALERRLMGGPVPRSSGAPSSTPTAPRAPAREIDKTDPYAPRD